MSSHTTFGLRPALAELPARPLNQRLKATEIETSPVDVTKDSELHPLTPPATPQKSGAIQKSISINDVEPRSSVTTNEGEEPSPGFDPVAGFKDGQNIESQEADLRLYYGHYQVREELGYGVWSNVYLAREIPQPTTSDDIPPSPPTSSTTRPVAINAKALAVKVPSRRAAHHVLEKEARTLTVLHSDDEAVSYLVPFHGWDAVHQSVVLDAVPLSLEAFAKSARTLPLSTKTMFDPIIGTEKWIDLALALISGLTFLHRKGCVHGDIKPANILLQPGEEDIITPLYCDFSSSRIVADIPSLETEAVTTEYTSPELLGAFHRTNSDRAVVSFASDVFALAVTLLFTAIGESPYACAHLDLQKLAMAKDGTPLEYARRGQQASRVMKGRAVDRALKGGLSKDPEKRSTLEEWTAEVQEISKIWRDGGWSRGG